MKMLEELQVLEILMRLPNEAILTSEEAALVLRSSISTLERLRRSGKGPLYIQDVKEGAKGTNQKVRYRKQALMDWLAANEVSSIMEAAKKRGMGFATLHQVFEPVPFWRSPGGLAGRADISTEDEFFERFGKDEVVWMVPFDAATETWEDANAHRIFAESISGLLTHALGAIGAAVERSELGIPMLPPDSRGRKLVDLL